MNTTASPETNHGDPNLSCEKANAWSVLVFFFVNYVAHSFTVRILPAESTYEQCAAAFIALIFPSAGLIRAVDGIVRHSRFSKNGDQLSQAARAGALLMVIRDKYWRAMPGDSIRGVRFQRLCGMNKKNNIFKKPHDDEKDIRDDSGTDERFSDDPRATMLRRYDQRGEESWSGIPINSDENDYTNHDNSYAYYVLGPPWLNESLRVQDNANLTLAASDPLVHGSYKLPEGYRLAFVPSDARISSLEDGTQVNISSSYNGAKALLAIAQTLYAAFTLYRARGDQIERYGYAAFGLTVTPYLIMSMLNSLADALTPNYPTYYLVRSEEMYEAERREGCYFDGVVGRLMPEETSGNRLQSTWAVVSADREKSSCQLQLTSEDSTDLPFLVEAYHFGSKIASSGFLIDALTSGMSITVPSCNKFQRGPLPRSVWTMEANGKNLHNTFFVSFLAPLAISLASLAVNGALSRFQKGNSTPAQRGWIMSWFVLGMVSGFAAAEVGKVAPLLIRLAQEYLKGGERWTAETVYIIFYSTIIVGGIFVPGFGGFVMVGKMLMEYGICKYKA